MIPIEKEFDNYSFGNECLAAHSRRLCATNNVILRIHYEELKLKQSTNDFNLQNNNVVAGIYYLRNTVNKNTIKLIVQP
jgi:hypothetical protein